MRIGVVTEAGAWGASARYRALQHVERLAEQLGDVDVLLPDDVVERRPGARGRALFFAEHGRRYVRRARELGARLGDYDALLVQRGVYPLGPGIATRAVERFAGRVVYDLDDAVFVVSPGLARKGRGARWLYGPHQAVRLLRRADAIVVSTENLAALLPFGLEATAVLPTVPDPARYPRAEHANGKPALVGWVGNQGNLDYLDPLAPVMERLSNEGLLRLEVVSSAPWHGPATFRPWSLAEEASVFARHAIGIMPLPEGPYTRAKAGFKLLQSLAAGVPVVASPVGVNRHLVEASGAGLLAETADEWEDALRRLAGDVGLRARLGARGRDLRRAPRGSGGSGGNARRTAEGRALAARLIICSKSPWEPSIRREHALARLAAANGHEVVFLEPGADVRTARRRQRLAGGPRRAGARRSRRARASRCAGAAPSSPATAAGRGLGWRWSCSGVSLHALDVPGQHRGRHRPVAVAGGCLDPRGAPRLRLRRRLGREDPAAPQPLPRPPCPDRARSRRRRRGQRAAGRALRPATPRVIPNGTPDELLASPPVDPPSQPRLVFVGTLSERFDAPLLSRALDLLPGWQLELYGQCQYAGSGDRPDPELASLLEGHRDRATWHGVVGRTELARVLDAGRVLVVPYRRLEHSGGAMKLFDYAARGRPIVSTRWTEALEQNGPPHLYLADTATETAVAVKEAAGEPRGRAADRRAWAEAERHESRWPAWSEALFGA